MIRQTLKIFFILYHTEESQVLYMSSSQCMEEHLLSEFKEKKKHHIGKDNRRRMDKYHLVLAHQHSFCCAYSFVSAITLTQEFYVNL